MLTRLEVDGFKNLLGFDCYFGPYTCIAGPNAVGKSNVFDAIEFMALLADHTFLDATQLLRGRGDHIVDPKSLFWNNAESADPVMRFAAEMIVPPSVTDDFGDVKSPTTSFLRYEVALRYLPPGSGRQQTGRLRLEYENLMHLKKGEAHLHLPWKHSKMDFRDKAVFGRRSAPAYISTTHEQGSDDPTVNVHQDGGSRGQPRRSRAILAPRTAVALTTSTDDPTILAARREMQQWKMLALEPSAMRSPDNVLDDSHVTASGAHLAATLFRMTSQQGSSVFDEVAADTAALTDIRELTVDHDERRDTLTLEARLGEGPMLPARSLSDGTLRFLALCIMRSDDEVGGLLCMEEPENGIHPGRVETMVDLVRSLAVDPFSRPGPGNPMRQIMVNTHSPHFVRYQDESDVLAAMAVKVSHDSRIATTVRLMPMPGTWRTRAADSASVSKESLDDFLREPEGALFSLDWVDD